MVKRNAFAVVEHHKDRAIFLKPDYDLDIDWYLANGYSKAEDMFRRIERGYGSISQEEICNNEWLTIDEAKEETMKAISKEYEGY